eukprot:SAG31_NODE_757_length_12296_cov_8.840289_5_plen_77_part_00
MSSFDNNAVVPTVRLYALLVPSLKLKTSAEYDRGLKSLQGCFGPARPGQQKCGNQPRLMLKRACALPAALYSGRGS